MICELEIGAQFRRKGSDRILADPSVTADISIDLEDLENESKLTLLFAAFAGQLAAFTANAAREDPTFAARLRGEL